jgi:hypothetical protein
VIIDKINVLRVAIRKTEDHPPIGANRHCPKAFEITLKRVQSKARQVHIRDRTGSVKTRENVTQLYACSAITPRVSSSS